MAKKLPIVHCRCCKKDIDRNTQQEGVDWIMKSRGWYYHVKCLESWVANKDNIHSHKDNAEWMDYAWDFLTHDIKISVDYIKLKKQWESFLKKNMTSKGIYFCLKYFYDVKHGDKDKSQGGIGIIPYIYQEGCQYWVDREAKEEGICARIEEQLRQRAAQQEIVIKAEPKKKIKKQIVLDDIGELDNGNS